MRISDWRSDVCSSELQAGEDVQQRGHAAARRAEQGVGAAVIPDVVDLLQREVGVALRPVERGVGERVERAPRQASSREHARSVGKERVGTCRPRCAVSTKQTKNTTTKIKKNN